MVKVAVQFGSLENHTQGPRYSDKKEKTRNTLVNAKRPLRTPEGHFVLFAGHSSKSGVLGNSHSNVSQLSLNIQKECTTFIELSV